ncbi:capsid protein [Phyllosticta citriasiana partitivirus 1]|nr:capsid protein [Phyllosticta citriasiana partitivirus 1]
MSSSVTPGDSASSAGKRKARPGKRERAEAKGLTGTGGASPSASSLSGARAFAAGAASAPVPQPGRYPVVFPSGAGEPSRDSSFAYDGAAFKSSLPSLAGRFDMSGRLAEFLANAELERTDFETVLLKGVFLGLAQQTVHAHVNMGLPLGDFSPVASSDVTNFASIRAFIAQFGEFSSEVLGTRFLLAGYSEEVKSLVRAARLVGSAGNTPSRVCDTMWLPVEEGDPRTKFILAEKLALLVRDEGISLDVERLAEAVLAGSGVPEAWTAVKPLLGAPPPPAAQGQPAPVDRRDRFDFVFSAVRTADAFLAAFGDPRRSGVLTELGLAWNTPAVGDLAWGRNVKQDFSVLADQWARIRPTITKFFSSGSGLANRSAASGSPSQLSRVKTAAGVTVVRTKLSLSAPELSLAACFPALWFIPEGR